MSIQVRCEECGQGYRLKPSLAGKVLPCKECGAEMLVPRPRSGRSSAEIRTRASQSAGIPTGVWVGGGVGVLLLLIVLGVFLWTRDAGSSDGEDAVADSSNDETKNENVLPPNTWSAPKEAIANLGEEIAIGPYSIRMPKGWMLAHCRFGSGEAVLEWKWPEEEIKARLEFSVRLDPNAKRGDEPNIIVDGKHHTLGQGYSYLYIGADPPVEGRINGASFHRVDFPKLVRGQPNTHSEYIAILDGASVKISTDVLLPEDTKLPGYAKATALSFKEKASVPPLVTLDEMRQPRRQNAKGFPKPRVVSEDLADWGLRSKHRFLGERELAILLSGDDAKSAIISTPKPNYIAIKGVVYSLLDGGKEAGRFAIPRELENLDHKALSDDGQTMAFADDNFSRENGKIHLLTDGGKTWKHVEESRTRSIGSLRLEFIRFLPDHQLAAGWRMSPKQEIDVYNLKTGDQKRFWAESAEGDAVAFSPDSRFLAFIHDETRKLVLDQIQNPGQLTGLRTPADINLLFSSSIKGLVFSPDGTQLAGIVSGRLICWSINGGLLLDSKLPAEWSSYFNDDGPAIQWLADGSGWLVWGQHLVDRIDTKLHWSLPKPDTRVHLYQYNRILNDGRILIGQGDDFTPYGFVVYARPK